MELRRRDLELRSIRAGMAITGDTGGSKSGTVWAAHTLVLGGVSHELSRGPDGDSEAISRHCVAIGLREADCAGDQQDDHDERA